MPMDEAFEVKSTKSREINRNYYLDFVKGIACICVVFMHCEFPGRLGIIVQTVSRFCVPFFFMVSGFFCFGNDLKRIQRKTLRILIITASASLFYLVIAFSKHLLGLVELSKISIKDIGLFVFFNNPVLIAEHLWFLFALLYDYCLFGIITKIKSIKFAHVLIPVLAISYVFLAQGAVIFGIHIPKLLYRNWLIEGFTFFMLGHWLHTTEDKARRIGEPLLLTVIVCSTLLCVVERHLMGRDFGVNILSFPQVICIFVYAMNHAEKHKNSFVRKLGSRCSMFVYILHPFVWHCLEFIYEKVGINEELVALYILPLLVLGTSILLSLLITVRKKEV